ncbi:hypothetical protein IAU60_000887 [Kwoniella sp. DSM 27419]
MPPLDLGGVGDTLGGVADKVTDGAGGALATATEGAGGVVATAVAGAQGAIETAQDQVNQVSGLLGWLKQIQRYIDQIQEYWDQYQDLIIFIFCLIVFIYVMSLIYCCYHCCHDFCRCAGCYLKCTWRIEEFIRKRGWRSLKWCCRRLAHSSSRPGSTGKNDYHGCSDCCLKMVPRATRMDLEKQHGDLRGGWHDPTYLGRACGRYELPDDPVERAKWHWWGHETWRRASCMIWLFPCGTDKQKRVTAELEMQRKRDAYYEKLRRGIDSMGDEAGDWGRRINVPAAARLKVLKKMYPRNKAEKRLVKTAAMELNKKEASDSDSNTAVESDRRGDDQKKSY